MMKKGFAQYAEGRKSELCVINMFPTRDFEILQRADLGGNKTKLWSFSLGYLPEIDMQARRQEGLHHSEGVPNIP